MPTETPNGHETAGKLRAALWVMRRLAHPEAAAPDVRTFRGKRVPTRLLADGLRTLPENLLTARGRGGDRWKAAAEVFREVPDLLEPGVPGSTMDRAEEERFIAGYGGQLGHYRERFGQLLH